MAMGGGKERSKRPFIPTELGSPGFAGDRSINVPGFRLTAKRRREGGKRGTAKSNLSTCSDPPCAPGVAGVPAVCKTSPYLFNIKSWKGKVISPGHARGHERPFSLALLL